MATPVKYDEAGPGNESTHLSPVLHRGESIVPTANQKRRTADAGQIGPSIKPAEKSGILAQEHPRSRQPCHATKTARCGDSVRPALVGDRGCQVRDASVELSPPRPIVTQASTG